MPSTTDQARGSSDLAIPQTSTVQFRKLAQEDKDWYQQLYRISFADMVSALQLSPELTAQTLADAGWSMAERYLSSCSPPSVSKAVSSDKDHKLKNAPVRTSFVAIDPRTSDPLGCLLLLTSLGEQAFGTTLTRPCSKIQAVMVDPKARRRGIANKMMDTAEGRARRLGSPIITLWTHPVMEAAVRLYARRGYRWDTDYPESRGDQQFWVKDIAK